MKIPVGMLGKWLRDTMQQRQPIIVSGGLRGTYVAGTRLIDALELADPAGTTARVLLEKDPPPQVTGPCSASEFPLQLKLVDKNGKKLEQPIPINRLDPSEAAVSWWKGWSAIFTAGTLVQPRIDPVRLSDVLHEPRVIRLFCDTNAMANGVAEWLLHILPSATQLISSAIADKEIMSWTDQKPDLYKVSDPDYWETQVRFLLARRLTEYPPKDTVIDRLSPDQNALMLASGTTKQGDKSPAGDLLFVELARPIVREQPRQARVVFLTGDANLARAATSALGPEHVLYANVDTNRDAANALTGQVLARGFWHPERPLGLLSLPSVGRLLWNLFSAFSFLILQHGNRRWLVELSLSVRHGGPSDWADPWVNIEELEPTGTGKATTEERPPDHEGGGSAQPLALVRTAPDVPVVQDTHTSADPPSPISSRGNEVGPRAEDYTDWLLAPRIATGPKDAISSSPRLDKNTLFSVLKEACLEQKVVPPPSAEVPKETYRCLVLLQAIDGEGNPGARALNFVEAWRRNDRDWIHAELMQSHPGYRSVVEAVREQRVAKLTSRQQQFLPMVRCLGQAAQLTTKTPLRMGDSPVSRAQLEKSLSDWLPNVGNAISTQDACERALESLGLTPVRFGEALSILWGRDPDSFIEPKTAGQPEKLRSEAVVELHRDGTYEFRDVTPSALFLERIGEPVLFLTRRR